MHFSKGSLRSRSARVLAIATVLMAAPLPARADWCLQLTGTTPFFPFPSGGLFVRFKGSMPRRAEKIAALNGRIGGATGGPVFGTAVVHGQVELAATYFLDSEQGQFWLAMDPPFDAGQFQYGYGDYQSYGVRGATGEGTVVSCASEPLSQ